MNIYGIICLTVLITSSDTKKQDEGGKPTWAKKDIRDYSDADMERLFDQWEEDEEPLEPDELPEHLRPSVPLDFSNIDTSNPENILKLSKKGKTLMVFVTVDTETRDESEKVTQLWQTSLWNNHIQAERYLVSDNRAIFLFKDGSRAWDAKDYLVQQEKCLEVNIENKPYYGLHTKEAKREAAKAREEEMLRNENVKEEL